MKRWALAFLFISQVAYAADGEAPPSMPLETQEKVEALTNAISALETIKVQNDQFVTQKTNECMKAIGNPEFCHCIAEKSPGSMDFADYVAIITAPKEKIKYEHLSPENKKLVDTTRKARDECINWKGKPTS